MFIDETWVKTNMAPLRGWFARGKWLKAKVPHGNWKTMTFIAALRHDRIDAPFVFDGPINAESVLTDALFFGAGHRGLDRVYARTATITAKRFAALSLAVSTVVRTSASASAAHLAR